MRKLAFLLFTLWSLSAGAEEALEAPGSSDQGRVVIGATLGAAFGGQRAVFAGGVSVGIIPISGVLPRIRGLVIASDAVGGELATSLTLSPPIRFDVIPFVIGEVGRRWLPGSDAWLYGAGGGVWIGRPSARVVAELGFMVRRLAFPEGSIDASGPIVGLLVRL